MIGRIGFMAGAEVEDVACATAPGEAGSEDFAALEPGNEDGFQRLRYGELLAVHFLVFQHEIVVDTGCDRVARVDGPEAFALAGLAPLQRAGRAHQALEDLREVAGVQNEKAHAFPDALGDTLDDDIGNGAVVLVAPPGEDIGFGEAGFGQAVFRLLQRRRRRADTLDRCSAHWRWWCACPPDRCPERWHWWFRGCFHPRQWCE